MTKHLLTGGNLTVTVSRSEDGLALCGIRDAKSGRQYLEFYVKIFAVHYLR